MADKPKTLLVETGRRRDGDGDAADVADGCAAHRCAVESEAPVDDNAALRRFKRQRVEIAGQTGRVALHLHRKAQLRLLPPARPLRISARSEQNKK